MIPVDKLDAVNEAVQTAFGTAKIEDVRMITNGQSGALVYRIVVQGSPYLLRLVTRTPDPTLADHFTCMNLAADAGLAPRVRYASLKDRLSIADFVDTKPLSRADALARMPATLRALHALPPFPQRADPLNTTCTFLLRHHVATAFIQRFQAANPLPAAVAQELFVRYEQVVSVYSRLEPDPVSSHNDLFKPDNILSDGNRVWLVDWEAAFLNDRYADLAVVANLLVDDDDEEKVFLAAYLGYPPGEAQMARFWVMRQLSHIFYAMGFLFLGTLGNHPIDWAQPTPSYHAFQRRFWTGDVDLAGKPEKITFGRVHLERLLENAARQRYTKALQAVLG